MEWTIPAYAFSAEAGTHLPIVNEVVMDVVLYCYVNETCVSDGMSVLCVA